MFIGPYARKISGDNCTKLAAGVDIVNKKWKRITKVVRFLETR